MTDDDGVDSFGETFGGGGWTEGGGFEIGLGYGVGALGCTEESTV